MPGQRRARSSLETVDGETREDAMTKRLEAKHKIDRRMGQNIWGRPKSPVNRREYGPGQHGQRRKGKLSDFGVQLRAKQKLKGYYANISEKQFRGIYDEAIRMKGDSGAAPDRPPGAAARRGGVPREVRADDVRRAPVRQPRPRQGERPAGQHPELPPQGRRRRRGQGQVEAARAGARGDRPRRARRARLHRGRPQQADREARPRARRSPRCPTRSRWSRIWWWNTTRAERPSRNQVWPSRSPGGILSTQDSAAATPWT